MPGTAQAADMTCPSCCRRPRSSLLVLNVDHCRACHGSTGQPYASGSGNCSRRHDRRAGAPEEAIIAAMKAAIRSRI